MAEELNENVVALTSIQIKKMLIQQEQKLLDVKSKQYKDNKKILESLEKEAKKKKALLELGGQLAKDIDTEIKTKKSLHKSYQEQIKLIEQSGMSIKQQTKAIKDLQQSMSSRSRRAGLGDIYDTSITLSTLGKNLKGLKFGEYSTALAKAGGAANVLRNTFTALGGSAGLATAGIGLLATGVKAFYDNILVPSARMRNVAGQQLGVAASSRNLWGGSFLREWAGRTLLGYSGEEQKNLYSSLVDALRINPNEPGGTAKYQNALTGMMAVQRLWGTDTGTLNKFYKAYSQTGTSTLQLSERFNKLMRSVEGTGWTTSEYADTLGRNIMYLKNFGINLDTYSKNLLKYGQAIRQEKLTIEEISPKMRGESSGELAFVAQEMLKSGVISERQLGAGLGDSIFKQSGALRIFATRDPIRYKQLLYKMYLSSPQYRSLLEGAGVLGDNIATWELMTRLNAPGMSALSEISTKGPSTFFDILSGRLGSTPSTGLGETATQSELVSDAMKNLAQQTTGFRGLLIAIAGLIKDFSDKLQVQENPQGFQTK